MSPLLFNQSKSLSIGLELELQLINPKTNDLTPQVMPLLKSMESIQYAGAFKPEITHSMIEINSTPHNKISSLHEELQKMISLLCKQARTLGITICGGGTHPFQNWRDRLVVSDFDETYQKYDFWMKKLTVFGQHIHLGCETGDDAIYLLHALSRYIPHFIALSAASPFYEGHETQFHSARLHALDAFPLSGTSPFLETWEQFQEHYHQLETLGVIKKIGNLYWDIRPQPIYGTIEIRIFDTPLTLEDAIFIAAYTQALALYLLEERPFKLDKEIYLAYNHNRFQSARYGFEGVITTYPDNNFILIQDDILNTLAQLKPYAKHLGTEDYFSILRDKVSNKQNGATELRKIYQSSGSLQALVEHQSNLWMNTSRLALN